MEETMMLESNGHFRAILRYGTSRQFVDAHFIGSG